MAASEESISTGSHAGCRLARDPSVPPAPSWTPSLAGVSYASPGRSRGAPAPRRSRHLRIFPDGDFGISCTSSTARMRLCGATCSATNAVSAAPSKSSLAGTTNAFGNSPPSSSGTPITAQSVTLGVGGQDRLELGGSDLLGPSQSTQAERPSQRVGGRFAAGRHLLRQCCRLAVLLGTRAATQGLPAGRV